jgi:choline dehydrogenase-like flavoprotein
VGIPSDHLTVIDSSVLPALPHSNPMLAIAVGARRAALRHV